VRRRRESTARDGGIAPEIEGSFGLENPLGADFVVVRQPHGELGLGTGHEVVDVRDPAGGEVAGAESGDRRHVGGAVADAAQGVVVLVRV